MYKLLTLSIPTYNRPNYLSICLSRIVAASENIEKSERKLFSVLVSDNSDNVFSKEVVNSEKFKSLRINYIKNEKNIGF